MSTTNTNSNQVTYDSYYTNLCATFGEEFAKEFIAAMQKKKEQLEKKAARAKARQEKGITVTAGKKSTVRAAAEMQKAVRYSNADLLVKQANALCVLREKYETETLARSNKELYGILADVYRLFLQAISKKCLKETVKSMRDELVERGTRVQGNTNAMTVFVRYVFNSDRKRAYNYASTLQAALQADVKAENLAEFIESKNGVEECKREFRKSDERKSKEACLAAAAVSVVEELSTMQAQQVVKLEDARVELTDGTKFVFVVARTGTDGTLELLQVVRKTTVAMQNAAVKELAKQYVEKQEAAKEVATKALKKAGTVKVSTAKAAAMLTVRELDGA